MIRKKMLLLLIVTVLVIGGIPLASAGFVPGTDLTTKVQLIDASDPAATPVTYPDGQQYIELNDTYSVGETFTVWANVTNVTELNWYTAGVTYDDSILECTDFVEGEFFYRAPLEYRTSPVNQPMPDSGTGFLGGYADITWVLKKPGNVSGSGTLVEFDFEVVGEGFTYIDVIVAAGPQQTTLVDLASTDLPYNTIDIVFDNILAPPAPPANIYVNPSTNTVEAVNDTFNVNITISDINFLASWQAGISFNPSVLECLAFEEGDFLSNVGTTVTSQLGAEAEIDNFLGKVTPANCSLTDPGLSASGSGTLARVTFKVKDYGMSAINITDVILLDVTGENALFNIVHGEFLLISAVNVPDDYPTIQEAVDSVSPGQTIMVAPGTYYEHVTINKSLTLIGKEGTIIDGGGGGEVVYINTSNFDISGFTIQNGLVGIYVRGSNNNITGNTISNNWCGIFLVNYNNNTKNNFILDNAITSNDIFGLWMFGACSGNIVINNVIAYTKWGIFLQHAKNNAFHHNSIINNTVQLNSYKSLNRWDDGAGEGNYWSDYTGLDDGSDGRIAGDGVGDTNLPHQGVDYYPLVSQLDKEPPLADAGPDQTVEEDTLVNFDGSGSTDNVGITSYEWDFGDGNTGTGVTPTHTYTTPGTYTVVLTVRDKAGNEDTDSCIITVTGVDVEPPKADAGPDQTVTEDTIVTVNGSASTDNVGIVSYEWDFGDGNTGTGVTPTHTYTTPGTYTVVLTVRDKAGNEDTDSCIITVTGVDVEPPKADAGPDQNVDEDTPVTFDGSASTDNFGITSYTWTFIDVTLQTLTGANPTYTFTRPASYTVTLNVTDAAGYWAIDTVVITVLDVTPPVVDAGLDQTVDEDTVVTLTSAFCDPEGGTISKYQWEFGDGTEQLKSTSGNLEPGETIDHIYTEPGIYTVTLAVWDKADNKGTDSCTITVLDVTPPVAKAGSNQIVRVGETVIFDGTSSTDNVGIVSYEWDFGDGNTGTGATIDHTYIGLGEYTATLTVKDAAGNSVADSILITVEAAPAGYPLWIVGAAAAGIAMIALIALFALARRRKK